MPIGANSVTPMPKAPIARAKIAGLNFMPPPPMLFPGVP
jgi:hypothetical protein